MIGRVQLARKADIPQCRLALHLPRPLAETAQRRHQQSQQQRDDADHHQQFHQ